MVLDWFNWQVPYLANHSFRFMADNKVRALSAALKHNHFHETFVMIDADNKRWVMVTALLASKRRFLTLNRDDAVKSMCDEVDEQGRRRFRLFTDIDGVQWINALNRAERVSGLF